MRRVLLVNPVYKETWDLPGGAVEAEESPRAACRREVAEELGLDRPPGLVTPLLARRVASRLDAVATGAVAALENGSPAA